MFAKFVNGFSTTLSAAITSSDTSLTVASTAGFPTSLQTDEFVPLALFNTDGTVQEIVYATGVSGTSFTIERGMEGSVAQAWAAGDPVLAVSTDGTMAKVSPFHVPTASETLPIADFLIVTPGTLSGDITLTLNTANASGSRVRIYGSASAYTVTIKSTVASGSPYIQLPDDSEVYSRTIPASSPTHGMDIYWDGGNWRAETFGQMVVANAVNPNEATALGQVLTLAQAQADFAALSGSSSQTFSVANATTAAEAVNSGQVQSVVGVGAYVSNGSTTSLSVTTGTFTAPSKGVLMIQGIGATGSGAYFINSQTLTASLAGISKLSAIGAEKTDVIVSSLPMNSGAATTLTYTCGTSAAGSLAISVSSFFLATP